MEDEQMEVHPRIAALASSFAVMIGVASTGCAGPTSPVRGAAAAGSTALPEAKSDEEPCHIYHALLREGMSESEVYETLGVEGVRPPIISSRCWQQTVSGRHCPECVFVLTFEHDRGGARLSNWLTRPLREGEMMIPVAAVRVLGN